MSWPTPLLRQVNQRLLQFPRGYITRRYMSWRFCKQYRRLRDYIQDILLLRQPEVYVNAILSFQSVQLFITWKRADTNEMCQYNMFLYNSPALAKLLIILLIQLVLLEVHPMLTYSFKQIILLWMCYL